jgi:hypothetical protein
MHKPKEIDKKYPEGSLVFVWNADAGLLNAVKDSLHKWISPETYSCKLCQLTHGFRAENLEWREFLDSSGRPVFFFYRDTFQNTGITNEVGGHYPLVVERRKGDWRPVLKSEDFDQITSLQELIAILSSRISHKK